MARTVAAHWKQISPELKMEYESRSELDKERFEAEYAEWKKAQRRAAAAAQAKQKKRQQEQEQNANTAAVARANHGNNDDDSSGTSCGTFII
ncbi:hypothetical protein ACA910_003673 [Epithemia clementina (nom. ined.)]